MRTIKMSVNKISQEIYQLIKKREQLRAEKKYQEADIIRQKLLKLGYKIEDSVGESSIKAAVVRYNKKLGCGKIALFGSGEMSPTGRRIHEYLIKDFAPPVKIALLPTPAGFEENPKAWYQKLQKTLEVGLQSFRPQVVYINALRKDGEKSTNNETLLKEMNEANYIHTGAGSPSYAIRHLKNSLAYQILCDKLKEGTTLSFASAAAIAMSKFSLPVYEIYKAGQDLFWEEGLNFFSQWNLNISVIPHWNNKEGGVEIDTSFCYLGKKRFNSLKKILPQRTNILCIAEQTACIFDFSSQQIEVMGNGGVCLVKEDQEETYWSGQKFSFSLLKE